MQGNESVQMIVVAVFLFAIVASLLIAWTRPLPELAGNKYKKHVAIIKDLHQPAPLPDYDEYCQELRQSPAFSSASTRLADTIKATVDIYEAQTDDDFEVNNDVLRAAMPSIQVLLERIKNHGVEPELAEAIGALFVLVDGVTKQSMLDAESFDQRLKALEDQQAAQRDQYRQLQVSTR